VTSDGLPFEAHIDYMIAVPSVLIGILGILGAMFMYKNPNNRPAAMAANLKYLYKWSFNKFYIDEVYMFITKKIIFGYISRPIAWFDRHVIDGFMNGSAGMTNLVSYKIRGFQSGQLQKYGFVFVTSALALALVFIYLWTN
jgi:NADH-quinone oxidoreductase subunit L